MLAPGRFDLTLSAKAKRPRLLGSWQRVKQRPGVLEIRRTEALAEPGVDRGEEVVGLGAFALGSPQPRKARSSAQLQGLRLLAPGCIDSLLEPRCCFGSLADPR